VPAVSAANSSKMSAARSEGKPAPQPIARAKRVMMTASGSASPGGSTNLGSQVSRRSELVMTPSFSGHWAAARSTSAKRVVSVG
jgi:hypothetical protein